MPSPASAADSVTDTFQKALFEEEANQNYDAAMRAYRDVVARMDEQRKLAATAVFRLGECYRKLGQTNEAVAQYQRIVREFADQPTLVNLSQQNLAGLRASSAAAGEAPMTMASAAKTQEMQLLERQLFDAQAEFDRLDRLFTTLKAQSPSRLKQLMPTLQPDTALAALVDQEMKANQKRAELLQQFTDGHPEVKAVDATLKQIAPQIVERLQGILLSLDIQRKLARERVDETRKKLSEVQAAASRESGGAPALSQAARLEQKRLLEEEIKLAERQVDTIKKQIGTGRAPPDGTLAYEREILALRRQLAALDVGPNAPSSAGTAETGATDEEDKEIRRIQAMIKNSPDLINAPGPDKLTPLDSAARKGQLVVARFLLDNKADPNFRPRFGTVQFPLCAAAVNGHKAMVELLLARGAQVNIDDGAALRIAAEKGFISVVEALLAAKANPNLSDYRGETALHRAVENRFPAIAELLIKNGADVNAVNRVGKPGDDPNQVAVRQADGTPLHIAASQGDVAMVSLLLSNRADVNAVNFLGETPLHVGASQLPIVTNLLAAGADVNRAVADGPFKGWTPLLYAVSWDGTNAAKALLQAGADPNAYAATVLEPARPGSVSRVGHTPLFMAIAKSNPAMVRLLLDNKADPNKESPLTVVVANGDVASADALLEHGANVETKFEDGDTPLLHAARAADQDMVALLLKHKADPNVRTRGVYQNDGSSQGTPLLIAATEGYKGIAEVLLAQGADPSLKDSGGTSPLWKAVIRRDKPLAELLLTNGASVDTRFWDDNTCLAQAIKQRDLETAALLLDHHADPNATNKFGQTPLHLIVQKSREQPGNPIPGMPVPTRAIRPAPGVGVVPGTILGPKPANAGHPPAPAPAELVDLAKLLLDRKADPNLRDNNGMTPLNLFGVPANPLDDAQKALVALLRQHGAKDALPELATDSNVIRVWRQGLAKGDLVFTKDSNGLNRFTVMDVVVSFYGLKQQEWFQQRVDSPAGFPVVPSPGRPYETWWHRADNGSPMKGYLAFPDLGALKIHRPTPGGTNQQISVDLLPSGTREMRVASAGLDCRHDLELQFGDVLEIPERDHPLSDPPVGLTESEHDQLVGCLQRNAKLIFKGATNALELVPAGGRYLSRALNSPQALGILSTSADLSNVKVTRFNPATRAVETNFTVDVQQFRNDRRPISEDLALRDGDQIEVPDK